MDDNLPWHVRDNELATRFPENSSRVVVHEFHDDPLSPPRLERWETDERHLGSGGQGDVFLQRFHDTNGLVSLRAVKVIPLYPGSGHERNPQRYVRELDTIFRFSHRKYARHFVKSLGWYKSIHSDHLCIAMEYLPQGDLQTYLDNNPPLPEDECREIVSQVVTGLQIMHRAGFAHRDVKPANVLIRQSPTNTHATSWWVKLTDFGISKQSEAPTAGTPTISGTPMYRPPEALRWLLGLEKQESPVAVDYPATDMWSLGVMAFYMITRTSPFPGFQDILDYCNRPDLFPHASLDDCHTSPDGVSFIRESLHPSTAERLTSNEAIRHGWVTRHIPRLAAVQVAHGSSFLPSTILALGTAMANNERGLTTELSNITAMQGLSLDAGSRVSLASTSTRGERARLAREQKNGTSVQEFPLSADTTELSSYKCPVTGCLYKGERQPRFANREVFFNHLLRFHSKEGPDWLSKHAQLLRWAVSKGHEIVAKLVLETGADLESRDQDGVSLLARAASGGHETVARLLLEKGADIESRDQYGYSPLARAASEGHETVARLLLEEGADIESRTLSQNSPLTWAAYKGHETVVRLLLEKGADIESRDQSQYSPLARAASEGHETVARLLLEKGADIESRTDRKETPLFLAVRGQHKGTVKLLLENGANPTARDYNHHSVLGLTSWGDQELRKLVKDAAKRNGGGCTPF